MEILTLFFQKIRCNSRQLLHYRSNLILGSDIGVINDLLFLIEKEASLLFLIGDKSEGNCPMGELGSLQIEEDDKIAVFQL